MKSRTSTPNKNTPKIIADIKSPSSGKKQKQRRESFQKENISISESPKTPIGLLSPLVKDENEEKETTSENNSVVLDTSIRV